MERVGAADVLKIFKDSVKDMDKRKFLELFMNSAKVNVLLLSSLNEDGRDKKLSHVISFGTCGIYKVHNSLKHGENATGGSFVILPSSTFNIFHECSVLMTTLIFKCIQPLQHLKTT